MDQRNLSSIKFSIYREIHYNNRKPNQENENVVKNMNEKDEIKNPPL
jgi:hypothetical protein